MSTVKMEKRNVCHFKCWRHLVCLHFLSLLLSPSVPPSLSLHPSLSSSFCPALTVISSVLRLSQNVAGVTLLALGNGAPDIFSAFAAVNQKEDEKASLAVGALFGNRRTFLFLLPAVQYYFSI